MILQARVKKRQDKSSKDDGRSKKLLRLEQQWKPYRGIMIKYSVIASIIRALIGRSCEAYVFEANSGDELVDGLQVGLEGPCATNYLALIERKALGDRPNTVRYIFNGILPSH